MKRIALFVIFMLFPASFLFAATHVVNPSGSIQAAIDLAASGDTIVLADGTYTGPGNSSIQLHAMKGLVFLSVSDNPSSCIIDCQGQGYGFDFLMPALSSKIRGITVRQASRGGITADGVHLVIENCRVELCQGRGLNLIAGTYRVSHCYVSGNPGGGVYVLSGQATIENCQIIGNQASFGGGLYLDEHANVTLSNCLIAENTAAYGAGLNGDNPSVTVSNCDIVKNHGDGIQAGSGTWNIDHTIIALNEGVGLVSSQAILTCTDIWGNSPGGAAGNISQDPKFCDPVSGNYYLDVASPCVSAQCGLMGLYPVACGGPIGVKESTWGGIKNLYH